MQSNEFYISVCICTYKRPLLLDHLLKMLQSQITEGLFSYSIVIVDNDVYQSAQDIVKEWSAKSSIRIDYFCEPKKNISLARNMAIKNAIGNYIAFIDDDEFPEDEWLLNLFKTIQRFNCAGVLGPVKPHFESPPPQWILKGNICDRPSFPTGKILKNHFETRSGNVLLRKESIINLEILFDPDFGSNGGEDVDFFKRMMQKGFTFIWCNDAPVYESLSFERLTRSYHLNRALMRGAVNAKKLTFFSPYILKSILAVFLYSISLPFYSLKGHHSFMKYLIKLCDHIGLLLGLFGFKPPEIR